MKNKAKSSLSLLGLAFLFLNCTLIAADKPPNILIITVDNLGYGDLKSYEPNSGIITPHLDKMGQAGARLTSFYTASPTCTVSRGALLTGRIPQRNKLEEQLPGIKGNYGIGLRQSEIIIPKILKTGPYSYATGCFGKWNIGFAPGSRPTERGFDEYLGHASGNIDYYTHIYQGKHDLFENTDELFRDGDYSTDLFADAAIRFIEKNSKKDKPWFVYLPFNAPHFPSPGNQKPGEEPEWQAPDWAFRTYGLSPDEKDKKKRYRAVVTALDSAIGRVIHTLESLNISENTFVFLCSDNGAFMLPERGLEVSSNLPLRSGGVTCWEGGLRVVAFAVWPGKIKAGSIIDTPLWSPDILQACAALSESKLPENVVFDGKDPIPVLTGKTTESPHESFYFKYQDHAAFRFQNWKIVREKPSSAWSLFDLGNDISETKDQAELYPEKVEVMEKMFSLKNKELSKKPNVLFIISDDLTTTAVSGYENQACHTPNIDRLAAEGTRFTRAYCQFPVCGPSRASLLFGYYPHATETFGYVSGREKMGPGRKSWPQLFKENGYYTARVSKIFHMGIPTHIESGEDGRDDADSWHEKFNSQAAEWQTPGKAELVQNNPYGTIERKGGNVMTIVQADGDDLVHADGKTAQKAVELIRKHKNEPFFLAVGFVRPHVPFVAPKKYFEPYPYNQVVLPPQVANDWDDIPQHGINYVTSLNAQMSEEQEKKAIAGYYASVSFMDAQVGKVLQALRDEGLEDNTIVIFTSDHGFHLGEHRFWMKVSLKEESSRVPLIIKVPGKKPAVCHSFAELLDLYPTVADLAGLNPSPNLQGKSLAGLFDDPKKEVRPYAFSVSAWNNMFSFLIRSEKWAYIQYGEDGSGGIELFDMEHDSKQFNNLARNPRYKTTVEHFKEELKRKLKDVRTNDLGITYK